MSNTKELAQQLLAAQSARPACKVGQIVTQRRIDPMDNRARGVDFTIPTRMHRISLTYSFRFFAEGSSNAIAEKRSIVWLTCRRFWQDDKLITARNFAKSRCLPTPEAVR